MTDLNIDQTLAAEGFFKFLLDDKQKEMRICGPGGTGKSHLMKYLKDNVWDDYQRFCIKNNIQPKYHHLNMTAMTNKASVVLSDFIEDSTSTIYSHMNLVVKNDFNTGETLVKPSKQWKIKNNEVLFIDESSMMDTVIDNYVDEGNQNCKIVYVGDHCQLGPVSEDSNISPIYKRDMKQFDLTIQMRTNNPHLQNLNDMMRENVFTKSFPDIQLIPNVIDWYSDVDQLFNEVDKYFINDEHNNKIVAFTNKAVLDMNYYIRHLRKKKFQYNVGDTLVNNSAVTLGEDAKGVKKILHVEQEVKIKKINQTPYLKKFGKNNEFELLVHNITFSTHHDGTTDWIVPHDKDELKAVLKKAYDMKKWKEYFLIKEMMPDFRERDSSTVHKAQGSSYDVVFINLSDISICKSPEEVARMLYVAVSRARHRIIFFGKLSPKYGRLIW